MDEMKYCPFCGAIPTTEVRITQMGGETDNIDFSIVCENCGTYKTYRLRLKKKGCFLDVLKAMEEAVKMWNKRVEENNGVN